MTQKNQDFKKRPGAKTLEKIAREIRIEVLKMLACAGSGHTGGSLSMVELVVGLYFYKFNPLELKSDDDASYEKVLDFNISH